MVERPDLITDPRFIDNRARLDNDKALDAELQAEIDKVALDDLLRRSEEVGATIAPVNDVSMIFEDEQIKARESIVRVEDAQLGQVGMQNVVGKLSRTPGRIERAGPELGEHNREILVEQLGYSEAQLREFGITA